MFPDIANNPGVAAAHPGYTLTDYLGDEVQFEMAEVAFRYEHGKPLIRPEQLPHLSMMMRRLHDWYLKACNEGTDSIYVGIKDEHYFNGVERCTLNLKNYFSYTIKPPSTKLSSFAIIYKYFFL